MQAGLTSDKSKRSAKSFLFKERIVIFKKTKIIDKTSTCERI